MRTSTLAATSAVALAFAAFGGQARAAELTLCWAAWDPANALVELSKDFEAQTGHTMRFEFVPWPNFADRMLNELNSGGRLCDLLIGDSQWIGGSAENGHYVQLNDFFDAEGISMDDFMPATVLGYSEWPKGTPNYWALPAMADAIGWTYRRDWFENEEIRADFEAEHGRELEPPQTWDEFMEVARFFTGREIEGRTVYGASIFTERGSEGITMGVTNVMYPMGFMYESPDQPYDMEGFVNSAGAVAGLELYKEIFDCCTPPGYTDSYMEAGLDAFKSGQVAMQMNWFAFWPGLYQDPDVGGERIGFFNNPGHEVDGEIRRGAQLGGQGISVVAYSQNQDAALEYIKWFAQPEVQQEWWALGGYSAHKSVLMDEKFPETAPFAGDFLTTMETVIDFWAEPAYAELLLAMQRRVHDYVVADVGTAQEALDKLIEDWTEIFEDEGKL
jgi:multiple sugar transport system substrate-binding protein